MKQTLFLSLLFLLPLQVQAATAPAQEKSTLDWTIQDTWKISTRPLDFAESLDQKLVYVLGEDSKVHIYSAKGKKLGTIPVGKKITAIDIAPQGEMLYLIGSDQTYTAIDISFVKNIDITGSPFLGREDAAVTMVIFSDFQ